MREPTVEELQRAWALLDAGEWQRAMALVQGRCEGGCANVVLQSTFGPLVCEDCGYVHAGRSVWPQIYESPPPRRSQLTGFERFSGRQRA